MTSFTRTAIANMLQEKFLNGNRISPKVFDKLLQSHGNHERSRVLELLRCQRGIPIEQDKTGCYHVPESDLACYRADKLEMLNLWKREARYRKQLRNVNRCMKVMRSIRKDISPEAWRELTTAIICVM